MNDSIANYVKLEEFKILLVDCIKDLGYVDELKVLNETDLNKMAYKLLGLFKELKEKDSPGEKEVYLIGYVIGLLAKLVIQYGAKIEDI
jgi:hypothetical protein